MRNLCLALVLIALGGCSSFSGLASPHQSSAGSVPLVEGRPSPTECAQMYIPFSVSNPDPKSDLNDYLDRQVQIFDYDVCVALYSTVRDYRWTLRDRSNDATYVVQELINAREDLRRQKDKTSVAQGELALAIRKNQALNDEVVQLVYQASVERELYLSHLNSEREMFQAHVNEMASTFTKIINNSHDYAEQKRLMESMGYVFEVDPFTGNQRILPPDFNDGAFTEDDEFKYDDSDRRVG